MGRYHATDEYEDDPNEPDESDMDRDDGNEFIETIECPNCGRDVYEQAEKCPACGQYLSREESRRTGRPKWVVGTTVLLLIVILYSWVKWGM